MVKVTLNTLCGCTRDTELPAPLPAIKVYLKVPLQYNGVAFPAKSPVVSHDRTDLAPSRTFRLFGTKQDQHGNVTEAMYEEVYEL